MKRDSATRPRKPLPLCLLTILKSTHYPPYRGHCFTPPPPPMNPVLDLLALQLIRTSHLLTSQLVKAKTRLMRHLRPLSLSGNILFRAGKCISSLTPVGYAMLPCQLRRRRGAHCWPPRLPLWYIADTFGIVSRLLGEMHPGAAAAVGWFQRRSCVVDFSCSYPCSPLFLTWPLLGDTVSSMSKLTCYAPLSMKHGPITWLVCTLFYLAKCPDMWRYSLWQSRLWCEVW